MMRLRNLTMIHIDRHLRRLTDGDQQVSAPGETKTHDPVVIPVPEGLVSCIDDYVSIHRPPLLGNQGGDRLCITKDGNPMAEKIVFDRISATTRRPFGMLINPHQPVD
jgi:hypothetical protein